jgi:hypothetical protein
MFISPTIEAVLTDIRERHSDFLFMDFSSAKRSFKDIYDPELNFRSRTHDYLVGLDVAQFPNKEKWLGMAFNRSNLRPSAIPQGRPTFCVVTNVNQTTGTADTYDVKWGAFTLDIAIFSNGVFYLENFEEAFTIEYDGRDVIENVIFPAPFTNPVNIPIQNMQINSLQKLERNEFGSLIQLGITMELIIPIVRLRDKDLKAIILSIPFEERDDYFAQGQGGIYFIPPDQC